MGDSGAEAAAAGGGGGGGVAAAPTEAEGGPHGEVVAAVKFEYGWVLKRIECLRKGEYVQSPLQTPSRPSRRNQQYICHIRGRGCSFSIGEDSVPVDVDWQIMSVPENGSCHIASIARAIGRLDLQVLKQQASLEKFDWKVVEEWAQEGKKLLGGKDQVCSALRLRISSVLWSKASELRAGGYIPVGLKIGEDIQESDYEAASRKAKRHGMGDTGDDSIKQWAVAVLHEATFVTEEVVRAVLAADFNDTVAILVVRSDIRDDLGNVDSLHVLQGLVPKEAKFVLGLHLRCAMRHVDEKNCKVKALAALKKRARVSSQLADGQPAMRVEFTEAELEAEMKKINMEAFKSSYNRSHFQEVHIRNGRGGALVMDELRAIGSDAAITGGEGGRGESSGVGGGEGSGGCPPQLLE